MSKWPVRRKRGRVIPFGYKLSEHDPKLLEPVVRELDALEKAFYYLQTCSYIQVAQWLTKVSGRYISDVGLAIIYKKYQKAKYRLKHPLKRVQKIKLKPVKNDREHTAAETAEAKEDAILSSYNCSAGTKESQPAA